MITSSADWVKAWESAVAHALENRTVRHMLRRRPAQTLKLRLESDSSMRSGEITLHLSPDVIAISHETEVEDLALSGDATAWGRVLERTTQFMEAVNGYHGTLRWDGDAAAIAWATPVLQAVIDPAVTTRETSGETTNPDSSQATPDGKYYRLSSGVAYADVAGSGPPVVLLHTAGRDGRQWHPVMSLLSDNFTVVAPDLPGRGRSSPVGGQSGCLTDVDDIVAWVMQLVDKLGFQEYLVAGCSLGGNLSLLLGARDSRVRGIVALQGADYTPLISEASLESMDNPAVSLPHSNMPFTMSLVGADAPGPARDSLEFGVQSINAVAQKADLTAYSRCDFRDTTGQIRQPVVLFRGEDDWIVDAGLVDATARRCTGAAEVTIKSVPGVGHFPHVEAPALVAAAIREVYAKADAIE